MPTAYKEFFQRKSRLIKEIYNLKTVCIQKQYLF